MSALHMPSHGHVQTGPFCEATLGTLLDQLPVPLLMLDDALRVEWWNGAAEMFSGFMRQEVLGLPWAQDLLVGLDGRNFLRHRDGHLLHVRTQLMTEMPEHVTNGGAVVSIEDRTPSIYILEHALSKPELDLIDPLTQVGNRRLAAIEFEAFLVRHQLHRREFGVALFDVDLLHEIVNRFGYDCSDHALQVVARTLLACIEPHDLLCRWGGDQFLALLTGGHDEAQAKADLCRAAVEWSAMEWCGEPVPLTISGGVEMGSTGDHQEDLVGRAAFRLRISKRLGRNQVTCGASDQAE